MRLGYEFRTIHLSLDGLACLLPIKPIWRMTGVRSLSVQRHDPTSWCFFPIQGQRLRIDFDLRRPPHPERAVVVRPSKAKHERKALNKESSRHHYILRADRRFDPKAIRMIDGRRAGIEIEAPSAWPFIRPKENTRTFCLHGPRGV